MNNATASFATLPQLILHCCVWDGLDPPTQPCISRENGKKGRKKIKADVYYGKCIKVYSTPDQLRTINGGKGASIQLTSRLWLKSMYFVCLCCWWYYASSFEPGMVIHNVSAVSPSANELCRCMKKHVVQFSEGHFESHKHPGISFHTCFEKIFLSLTNTALLSISRGRKSPLSEI